MLTAAIGSSRPASGQGRLETDSGVSGMTETAARRTEGVVGREIVGKGGVGLKWLLVWCENVHIPFAFIVLLAI